MTELEIARANRDRLAQRWMGHMNAHHATAVLAIGVGHDHVSGQIVLCGMDEGPLSSDSAIVALLRAAADMIEKGEHRG